MSQDANQNLNLKINAKNTSTGAFKSLRNDLQGAGNKLKTLTKGFQGFGSIVGGAVVLGSLTKFSQLAIGQERALRRVAIATKNVGKDFKLLEKNLLSTTSALQQKTNFGDEEQIQALSKLIPMVGDYDKAVSKLPQLLDFAAFSEQSVTSSVRQFGQALQGNVEGLGRNFEFLKKMKTEGASTEKMLEALMKRIKGFAEADADPITQLGNSIGDVGETIGKDILPVIKELKNVFVALPESVRILTVALPPLGVALTALGGPFTILATALGVTVGAVAKLHEEYKNFNATPKGTEEEIKLAEERSELYTKYIKKLERANELSKSSKAYTIVKGQADEYLKKLNAIEAKQSELVSPKNQDTGGGEVASATITPSIDTTEQEWELEQKKARVLSEKRVALETELITNEFEKKRALNQQWFDEQLLEQSENADLLRELKSQKDLEILTEEKQFEFERERIAQEASDKRVEITAKEEKQKADLKQAGLQLTRSIMGAFSLALKKEDGESKGRARARKALALSEAGVAVALGVSRSLSLLPPANFISAAAVGVQGGVAISKIASQEFQTPEQVMRTIPGNSREEVPIIAHGGESIGRQSENNMTIIVQGDVFNADETIPKIAQGLREHKKLTGETI